MAYLLALLLLLLNLIAWASNLLTLPGNWVIVALAAAYAFFLPERCEPRLSWLVVVLILVLAILGEILEFAAGAAGAAKQGGSRRGMILAVIGAFAGSLIGVAIGVPVPVLGSIMGALAGAAIGSFIGAYLGELWAGRTHIDRLQIGGAAVVGRLLGSASKIIVGAVMVVLITADTLFDW